MLFQDDRLNDLSEFFKLFGDPTRLNILLLLSESALNVNEISERLEMTPSAVSHQLKSLKQGKLVKAKRAGKQMIYSLTDAETESLIRLAVRHIEG